MSDDSFGNTPDRFHAQPAIPVTAAPDSFSPEFLENPRVAKLSSEVRRLYGWLGLLTGISVLSIGLLAGSAYWLKLQQDRMQRQVSAVNSYKAEIDRLKNLESRINNLDIQTKSLDQNIQLLQQVSKVLPTQIKGVQNDISSVKASIQSVRASLQKVESNAVTRDQLIQTLPKGQQEPNKPANNVFPLPSNALPPKR